MNCLRNKNDTCILNYHVHECDNSRSKNIFMIMKNSRKYRAFTLAEVLITLVILGLVAALTIPSLINKVQDRLQITTFKKVYSMFSDAYSLMLIEERNPATWDWPSLNQAGGTRTDDENYFAQKLNKYLSVKKYCGSGHYGCFDYGWPYIGHGNSKAFYNLNKTNQRSVQSYHGMTTLKNDVRYQVYLPKPTGPDSFGGYIGVILVDVNGPKGPNRLGYDVFFIEFNKTKDLVLGVNFNNNYDGCSIDSESSDNGYSCSSWILKHNNMDYKYRDVSAQW